jgi:hypothetical protein
LCVLCVSFVKSSPAALEWCSDVNGPSHRRPTLLQDELLKLVCLMSQYPAESFYLSSMVQCHRFRVKFIVKVLRNLKLKLNISTVFF